MADVYLARRRVAGIEKRLVIKRLRRDRHRDPRFLDLFIREAQLSMSLVQQNIVPVFDFGRIGDHVFLAMEYIDGRDLGSSLARLRGHGLPPILAAFIAAECCQALDHAHRSREPVIHRDVTPRNVLLSWDGEVKLADFGIAAVVGEAAGMFGTPGYMAPEQANGEQVDARADVYSLGMVLWEALTGDHVRPVGDRLVTLAAARSGELPELPAAIPPALAAMIRRATEKDPAARFASARELGDELDAFMVVERAREGGHAPAKQLADWLAARWGDDREDPDSAETSGEAGAVVTFLEDGEEGIRGGTHTARSIAETAAEEEPAAAAPAPSPSKQASTNALAPARTRAPTDAPMAVRTRAPTDAPGVARKRAPTNAPGHAAGAKLSLEAESPARLLLPSDGRPIPDLDPPSADREPEEEAESPARRLLPSDEHPVVEAESEPSQPVPVAAATTTGSRRRWLLGALALTAIAAAALFYVFSGGRRGGLPAAPDAAAVVLAPADTPPIEIEPDAPPAPADAEPPPPDAAPAPLRTDAAIVRVPPRIDAGAGAGSGSGSGSARPTGPLRPIWINALPWAYFTVDGDPKQYETPTLLNLPAGPHRVTFMNPQLGVSRTVTVTVPAQGEARHVEKMN
jgi:hypothetical protein